jgi:hypothetical protein
MLAISVVAAVVAGLRAAEAMPCSAWEAASDPAPWGNRSDHAQVTLANGTVLIMGGGDYATNWTTYNDVWSTADAGSTWYPVTLDAPWHSRAYLTVTAVPWHGGERLVLVGGGHCIGTFVDSFCHAFEWYADVWVSDDAGATWNNTVHNLTSPFMARGGHAAAAVGENNRSSILFVGGVNGIAAMNDAWRSDNGGVSWTCVRRNGTETSASAAVARSWDAAQLAVAHKSPFAETRGLARARPATPSSSEGEESPANATATFAFHNLVSWKRRLWIIGGSSSVGYVNTVWSSADGGATWSLVVQSAPWKERVLPATAVVPSLLAPGSGTGLLLTGGSPQQGGYAYDDVWTSDDGTSWTEVTASATWAARGWQMMTTIPANAEALEPSASVTVVMTGGWTWYFPFQLEWTYFRDAWRCTI